MTTRVLLVDDHDLIRQGLRRAFEQQPDFEVVGEAGSVLEAHRLARDVDIDVVVVDVRLPDGSGLDLARSLRADSASLGIVVLTMYSGDDQLFGALDAGASAFVSKDAPSADVITAARHAVAAPRSFAAADLAEAMRRRMATPPPAITPREAEVLALLAEGSSVAELAKRLYVSESTAKSHISRLYEKLGASNRAQALMAAVRLGLIKQDGAS